MESSFNFSFSKVRVHEDDRAAQSARQLRAAAYTVGSDIVFNKNRYNPDSPRGKRLLAHELTHVAQQSNSSVVNPDDLTIGNPGTSAESEADALSRQVMASQSSVQPGPGPRPLISAGVANQMVMRAPDDEMEILVDTSPRRTAKYIDNFAKGVGYTMDFAGIYVFHGDPLRRIPIPNDWFQRGVTDAKEKSAYVHDDREGAMASIAGLSGNWFAFWKIDKEIILPTIFSPSSAPKICALIPGLYKKVGEMADETADQFVVMGAAMVSFGALKGLANWAANVPIPRLKTVPIESPATTAKGSTKAKTTKSMTAAKSKTTPKTTGQTTPTQSTQSTGTRPATETPVPPKPKYPMPQPDETPEAYYKRVHGEKAWEEVTPAMKNDTLKSTEIRMQVARMEHGISDPETVWTHYLTNKGYAELMMNPQFKGGVGKLGHQTGLRVGPGPFPEGIGLRTGRTYFDLKVTDKHASGSTTKFLYNDGVTFSKAGEAPIDIKIIRVGYKDGSHAVRTGANSWKLKTPKGTVREMDTETLVQLGEWPSEKLKMPKPKPEE
jgi:hypothetical protein